MPKEKLRSIEGVEIFSEGKWNGDVYSIADLDEMVRAFKETAATCRPALKLGHNEDQELLKGDGYPAAGWIGNLYRQGKKLIADFIDIPEKIYELIENKAYRHVSAEVYWDIECGENKYQRMLAAVALLGADMPAVTNLQDILANYGLAFSPLADRKFYALEIDGPRIKKYSDQAEEDAEMPKEDLEKLEAELKAYKAKDQEIEKERLELQELRAYKVTSEKELQDAREAAVALKLDKELQTLSTENLITPAMKPYIKELLGAEKKVYEFQVGDKAVKHSKFELLHEALKLNTASQVNKESQTEGGEAHLTSPKDEDAIKKYMADNDCSYGAAYRVVMRGRDEKKTG